MGCTEPIAIAYGAAYAVKLLGRLPERYVVSCSGNIIKNVKAVTVPQTGGLRGIEAAVLAGAIGGNSDARLEVLAGMTADSIEQVHRALELKNVEVKRLVTSHTLHIIIELFSGSDTVSVELIDGHTSLGNVIKNGEYLNRRSQTAATAEPQTERSLSVKDILDYAREVDLADVSDVLDRQIAYNTAISDEGLKNSWGAGIGRIVLEVNGRTERARLIARAAAGSDARMNGCSLPVVINSGSGNQGMTVSLPVIEYAAIHGISHDRLLRALCVSNLTAIHQKTSIGKLSAFCGAVSAAVGSAVGIAYLDGADYETICCTIENALGNVSGMVCDGAKSSCAAKISSALESALLGYDMAKRKVVFQSGEGIIGDTVEDTISSVGRMASKGMSGTDAEIIDIMIGR